IIFIQNSKYLEKIDFGYGKDQLLIIGIQDEIEYRKLKSAIASYSVIKEIGTTEHALGQSTYTHPVTFNSLEYNVRHIQFGENYFQTMNFNFVGGQPIDLNRASEWNRIVVNEQFVKMLQIQEDPIGKGVKVFGSTYRIVGVIENIIDKVTKAEDPEAMVFYPSVPEKWREVIVRTDANDLIETNHLLESTWKELFPTKPYVSRYQEDIVLGGMKQINRNLKNIFVFLTVLGGLLSIAGIYSLASLGVARRRKEIGIRKALGASVQRVAKTLNKEFGLILLVAVLLGSFGGYFAVSLLLDMVYPDHVPVGAGTITVAAAVIGICGLLTPTIIIVKAARANPVNALRND
ncbi:MAG: FtsX-like permease family protein, partial [Bacteroidota bacterium]